MTLSGSFYLYRCQFCHLHLEEAEYLTLEPEVLEIHADPHVLGCSLLANTSFFYRRQHFRAKQASPPPPKKGGGVKGGGDKTVVCLLPTTITYEIRIEYIGTREEAKSQVIRNLQVPQKWMRFVKHSQTKSPSPKKVLAIEAASYLRHCKVCPTVRAWSSEIRVT